MFKRRGCSINAPSSTAFYAAFESGTQCKKNFTLKEPVTETVCMRSDKYVSEKGVNAYILTVTEVVNLPFATDRGNYKEGGE